MKSIKLSNGREIGDGNPCYVIAEAGSNWKMGDPLTDLAMAKELIDVAKEAACDAVKFQTFTADRVYVKNAGKVKYLEQFSEKRDIIDLIDSLAMPHELLVELKSYCDRVDIDFMSSPFSVLDIKAVDDFVDFHKLASYEITHIQMIDAFVNTGKPVIFSTGASSWEEIDYTFQRFTSKGCKQLAMMQCLARYPASLSELHLNVIPAMKLRYRIPVGYSDHSLDPLVAPMSAVALGANIIEKHFTISRRIPGPDNPFAIEPDELKDMVSGIRDIEQTLGNSEKYVTEEEKELFQFCVRALQATKDINEGDILELDKNYAILRPGERSKGIHPKYIESIEGQPSKADISYGDGISMSQLD
jgi:sialic acid synthase SpsE